MQYKTLLFSWITFLALSPLLVTAIDKTTSWRILDTFKKEEQNILFETLPFDHSGSTELLRHEYAMNGLDGLKQRLKSIEDMYVEKKESMSIRRTSLEETITSLDNAIDDTLTNIQKTEKSISAKKSKIEEYQDISTGLTIRIKKNRAIILSYLINIYSEGTLIYNKEDNVDIIQNLILSDESVDSVSRDITYKSLVSILGQQFIKEYKLLISDYYKTVLKIRDSLVLLEADQILFEKEKSILLVQKHQREDLLAITKWQEELFQQYIFAQRKAQESVEKSWQNENSSYIASLDKLLEKNGCNEKKRTGKDIERCAGILSFYRNERALAKIEIATGMTNVMEWPIKDTKIISTYFRDAGYFNSFWSQHDAIDIVASQWTDVHAALDGYVFYMLPPVEWWYSYLALKHPGWYTTVYGHLSEILVKPYQFVRKWDVIARSGGAPGTPGAWPMTSGAHLHFEVYLNKTAFDPLRVLDISWLEYSDLPVRYQDKFIEDFVALSGTGISTNKYVRKFYIGWDTEEARQKYLLKTYATPDFQNLNTWINTALEEGIDPNFLICVWLAETTLGNYLKTSYNVWNVGNTDDGSVTSFSSPQEGIAWMWKTFNNRFLSWYTHVSELSRWWNPDGTIYASSNANWHNNIIRCISSLKWRFVEDDYNFRVK